MVVITVCVGSSCYIRGAHKVAARFQELIDEYNLSAQIELRGAFCHNRCKEGVAVSVNGVNLPRVTPENTEFLFKQFVLPEAMHDADSHC